MSDAETIGMLSLIHRVINPRDDDKEEGEDLNKEEGEDLDG